MSETSVEGEWGLGEAPPIPKPLFLSFFRYKDLHGWVYLRPVRLFCTIAKILRRGWSGDDQ